MYFPKRSRMRELFGFTRTKPGSKKRPRIMAAIKMGAFIKIMANIPPRKRSRKANNIE